MDRIFILPTLFFVIFSLIIYLIFNLNHEFIHPDSYIYILRASNDVFAKNLDFSGFNYNLDLFTFIKPLTSYFVGFTKSIGLSPLFVNLLLIASSFTILLRSKFSPKILKNPTFIAFCLFLSIIFVFNANNLYWVGRYTGDFLALFLISCLLASIQKKSRKLSILLSVLLVLVRTEFLFILPVLYSDTFFKDIKQKILAIITAAITPILMGIVYGEVEKTLVYVLLPLLIIFTATQIIAKDKNTKDIIIRAFKLLANYKNYLLIVLSLFLALYFVGGYIQISYPSFLEGFIINLVLMFSLIFIFVWKFSAKDFQIRALSSYLILSLVYLITAEDSFRYYLLLSPLLLISILENDVVENIRFKYKEILVFTVLQIVIFLTLIPNSVLSFDYWKERLDYFSEQLENKSVYSSTPIITGFYEFESHDICEINLENFEINENMVFILDKYSLFRCENIINQVYTLITQKEFTSFEFRTDKIVEIERFSSNGEISVLFVF